MQNLKILFLGEPKSANTISWVKGLEELGCTVYLASARVPGGDRAYAIGPVWLPPRIRMLAGIFDVRKIIREIKPDIIIAYRVTSYGFVAAMSGFHPLVIAAQNERIGYDPENSIVRNILLRIFASYAIRKADTLHAWAENVREGLVKFGAVDKQIMVMHRGIDTSIFSPPEMIRYNIITPRIVSTRSLYPHYHVDKLIIAFSGFLCKYANSTLTIIGDGPERKNLENLTEELGISNKVVFTGELPPKEVAKHLHESDIYVSLVQSEGLSSSLLEACGCGVFPVVADIPASHAIIRSGDNGVLLETDNPLALAKVLCGVIEDRGLRVGALETNIKLIKDNYDRRCNLEKFVAHYKKLISFYKKNSRK